MATLVTTYGEGVVKQKSNASIYMDQWVYYGNPALLRTTSNAFHFGQW